MCRTKRLNDVSTQHFMRGKALLTHDYIILVLLRKLIDIENIYKLLFEDYEVTWM